MVRAVGEVATIPCNTSSKQNTARRGFQTFVRLYLSERHGGSNVQVTSAVCFPVVVFLFLKYHFHLLLGSFEGSRQLKAVDEHFLESRMRLQSHRANYTHVTLYSLCCLSPTGDWYKAFLSWIWRYSAVLLSDIKTLLLLFIINKDVSGFQARRSPIRSTCQVLRGYPPLSLL